VSEKEIYEKLNSIHTDLKLIHADLGITKTDVAEHELILRGQSKMNGLVGDVKSMKTSQSNVQKIWILLTSGLATIIAWLEIDK
tara:strand:+ start:1461 stop:1712 length:252 start_codon:yes stop_codon:yes gene_type:complete